MSFDKLISSEGNGGGTTNQVTKDKTQLGIEKISAVESSQNDVQNLPSISNSGLINSGLTQNIQNLNSYSNLSSSTLQNEVSSFTTSSQPQIFQNNMYNTFTYPHWPTGVPAGVPSGVPSALNAYNNALNVNTNIQNSFNSTQSTFNSAQNNFNSTQSLYSGIYDHSVQNDQNNQFSGGEYRQNLELQTDFTGSLVSQTELSTSISEASGKGDNSRRKQRRIRTTKSFQNTRKNLISLNLFVCSKLDVPYFHQPSTKPT